MGLPFLSLWEPLHTSTYCIIAIGRFLWLYFQLFQVLYMSQTLLRTAVVLRKLCVCAGNREGPLEQVPSFLHSSNYSCVDSMKLSLPTGVRAWKVQATICV